MATQDASLLDLVRFYELKVSRGTCVGVGMCWKWRNFGAFSNESSGWHVLIDSGHENEE